MNTNCCTPNAPSCGCAAEPSAATVKTPTYLPSVDVHETADTIVITADLPGARADGVDLTFEDAVLTLRATVAPRHTQASFRSLHREYGIGDYTRTFKITDPIDRERIQAALADGVLTITLPKADSVRPRKIRINAANN